MTLVPSIPLQQKPMRQNVRAEEHRIHQKIHMLVYLDRTLAIAARTRSGRAPAPMTSS